ncbi:MAG: valine--tRNA ligase [Phycisphaerales bacterium]
MTGSPTDPSAATPVPDDPGGMPTKYRPSDHEPRIRELWERSGAFHADPGRVLRGEAEPYCIVIPPPNVTDRLHLGHALNNTLQDVLVRARRMMGFETLWMPGTDHAGIATQAVVERRLRKDGKLKGPLRESMKREEFVAIVQSFKDEYEATITGQLKAMGCSCDWARQRFTMDEQCARAVYEAFFRLFKDGLIYRGKRLVNWDPVLQTAVADDECEDVEVDGNFYYLRYPLVHGPKETERRRDGETKKTDKADAVPVTWSELRRRGWPNSHDADHADDAPAWVTVATTRPETYLGDTAVGVNPKDPRAKALRGLSVELPLVGRVIPIIEDAYVVMPARTPSLSESSSEGSDRATPRPRAHAGSAPGEPEDPKAKFATGFLKVTPAHDPNDYEIGQRHGLPMINIFAPDASISDKHGWDDVGDAHLFVGLSREEARKKVVMEFKARGLCERVVPYRHSVKHSDRSKAAIEPYLSDQWYVKVTDDRMKGAALRAAEKTAKQPAAAGELRSKAADEARGAGDGALQFHPERYAKTYRSWHENIRDWCISRQLWWGHRIPVWSREEFPAEDGIDALGETTARSKAMRMRVGGVELPIQRRQVGAKEWTFVCVPPGDQAVASKLSELGYSQDPDVLDTWFSSALWPLNTMGWPDDTDLLRAFNPTDTLCTAREIITLWVSRMVMFELYLMPADWEETKRRRDGETKKPATLDDMGRGRGPLPFRDVFIHAMIQDGEGRKMSKSLGNGVDPLDIIETHGADAMRFTLCQMATHTQDVRMPVERDAATGKNTSKKFDIGRNFCTKVWNAARFSLGMLEQRDCETAGQRDREGDRTLADRWMLSRLAAATAEVGEAVEEYQFADYAQRLYDLTWRDFCDWYLEAIKPTVATNAAQRAVLAHSLEVIVRLLHPIMPFVTEVIWERLRKIEPGAIEGVELGPSRTNGLLCTACWPKVALSLRDEAAERQFERLRGLITAIREVRATHQVPPKRRVVLHAPAQLDKECRAAGDMVATLSGLEKITTESPTGTGVPFIFEGVPCHLSNLADAVDAGAEQERKSKRLAELAKSITTLEGRLANPGYVDRAPPAMVEQTRDQLAKAKAERDAIASS